MDTIIQQVASNLKRHEFVRKSGRRAERYLLNVIETIWDFRYNINTRSDDLNPAFPDDEGYDPISYPGLGCIRGKIEFHPQEVLVDIGCGRGRALCVFSREPQVARCVGIEYHAIHAGIAQRNAQSVRGRLAAITIIQGDASEQNYADMTLIFLFNPFGEATMRRTIHRIGLSLRENPRPIRLVYVNPKHENVLMEQSWLSKTDSFFIPNRIHRSLPTSVWRSIGYESL